MAGLFWLLDLDGSSNHSRDAVTDWMCMVVVGESETVPARKV